MVRKKCFQIIALAHFIILPSFAVVYAFTRMELYDSPVFDAVEHLLLTSGKFLVISPTLEAH
jgi:hypothetical protein